MYKHYESEMLEDILYPMFKDMTFSLAQEFELKHRKKEMISENYCGKSN